MLIYIYMYFLYSHKHNVEILTYILINLFRYLFTAKSVSGELRSSEVKRIKVHTEDDEVCDLHVRI